MARRKNSDRPQEVTLAVLCGLPSRIAGAVAGQIEGEFSVARSREAPLVVTKVRPLSSPLDSLSYPKRVVQQFVRDIAATVFKWRSSPSQQTWRPRRIQLVYVRSSDEEVLLEEFGLAPLPIPIVTEQAADRHSVAKMSALAIEAIRRADHLANNLRQCVEGTPRNAPTKLPPRNFLVATGPLHGFLRQLQHGTIAVEEVERLVKFTKIRRASVPIDIKDRLFPHDPTSHGPARPAAALHELEAELDEPGSARRILERMFRFGFPLPDGFHHDVRRLDEKHFDQEQFECSKRGIIHVSAPYANVYPDDFVRHG